MEEIGAGQEFLALARLKGEIADLRRGRGRGRPKPHKLVLLLAVIDIAQDGLLGQNRIYFDDALLSRFRRHFDRYASPDDRCAPHLPFFHLHTSPFWLLKSRPGKDSAYTAIATPTPKQVIETFDYAYFSDYAYAIFAGDATRANVRGFVERLLDRESSDEALASARAADAQRRIEAFLDHLQRGAPLPANDRPGGATIAEWIRLSKRAGRYRQGKQLYESGALMLGGLNETALAEVEEDYHVCARNLTKPGQRATEQGPIW